MTLKAVDPIDITEAVLTASDIPEPDTASGEVEWEDVYSGLTRYSIDLSSDAFIANRYCNGVAKFSSGEMIASFRSSDALDSGLVLFPSESIPSFTTPSNPSNPPGATYSSSTFTVFNDTYSGAAYVACINRDDPASSGFAIYISEIDNTGSVTGSWSLVSGATWSNLGVIPYGFSMFGGQLLVTGYDSSQEQTKLFLFSDEYALIKSVSNTTRGVGIFANNKIYLSPSSGVVATSIGFDLLLNESTNVETDWFFSSHIPASTSEDVALFYNNPSVSSIFYIYYFSESFYPKDAYMKGDVVVVSSTHRKYQCLVDGTALDPKLGATEDASATWIDIGPTNKWAMFDEKTTTSTIDGTSFSMTFNPVNYVNAMAFFNVAGTESINITVKDAGGTERYNEDFALLDISPIYDYYTYFFYQNTSNDELVADDLPPYYDPEITVTFTGNAISVGAMVMGFANQIGTALTDTQTDTLDYSRQEYDGFGELTYIERPVVKLNTYEVLADKTINPYIQNLIKKLRGKNTLWIGDIGGGQKLITYGRYERSPIPFTMPNDVRYSITVRGSI